MNEDTNETTLEHALSNDDTTTNVVPPFSNAVPSQSSYIMLSASASHPYPTYVHGSSFVGSVSSMANGTYVQPSQQWQPPQHTLIFSTTPEQLASSDIAYTNISPADLATIRTMIHEEVQSLKSELVKQVKEELVVALRRHL